MNNEKKSQLHLDHCSMQEASRQRIGSFVRHVETVLRHTQQGNCKPNAKHRHHHTSLRSESGISDATTKLERHVFEHKDLNKNCHGYDQP